MVKVAGVTERELDILSVLWREGSGTVAEVRDELHDTPGYTSVLKMLQILERKDFVRHEREGRAYRYFPTLAPEDAGSEALGTIVDKIYHGSAESVLAQLVAGRVLEPDVAERMKSLVDGATDAQDVDLSPSLAGLEVP
jgi:BlaI family transcriptional regulator, penicillinase repressor